MSSQKRWFHVVECCLLCRRNHVKQQKIKDRWFDKLLQTMPSQFCLTHQCLQSQRHCRAVLLFCYIGTSSVHLLWHRVKLLQSPSQLGSNGSVVPSWLTHSRTHRIPYGRTPLYTKTAHCKKKMGKPNTHCQIPHEICLKCILSIDTTSQICETLASAWRWKYCSW